MAVKMVSSVLVLFVILGMISALKVDPNGYVMYCPCMGKYNFLMMYCTVLFIPLQSPSSRVHSTGRV